MHKPRVSERKIKSAWGLPWGLPENPGPGSVLFGRLPLFFGLLARACLPMGASNDGQAIELLPVGWPGALFGHRTGGLALYLATVLVSWRPV